MVYDDYCEIPDFYHETWQNARKEHKCCECGSSIKIGERYINCRGKWDGRLSVFKQHKECLEACVAIRRFQDDNCIPFGGFIEWYMDEDSYYGHEQKKWTKELRAAVAKCLWKARHRVSRCK